MASIARVTLNWTGGIGLPGFTVLHFRNSTPGVLSQAVVDNAVSKVDAMITAIKPEVPSGVTLATNGTVLEIDDTNGQLTAFWTGTPAAGQAGTGASTYSAPSGAVINWKTSAVRNGRLLRGRSFLVPLDTGAFDAQGNIASASLTVLQNAAAAVRAASGDARLVIFGRPTAPGATDGVSAEVTSSNVPDLAAILTSRRD